MSSSGSMLPTWLVAPVDGGVALSWSFFLIVLVVLLAVWYWMKHRDGLRALPHEQALKMVTAGGNTGQQVLSGPISAVEGDSIHDQYVKSKGVDTATAVMRSGCNLAAAALSHGQSSHHITEDALVAASLAQNCVM